MNEHGNETLGMRIARLRLAHGMTQEHLASLMHVSPQAVSKWENDLSSPDIGLLVPLAQTLGLSVDELLGAQHPASMRNVQEAREEAKTLVAPTWPEDEAADGEGSGPASLHIRVVEMDGDEKVDVSIPLSLFHAVKGIAGVLPVQLGGVLKGIDINQIASAASCGTLIDVDDGHDHVTITLE